MASRPILGMPSSRSGGVALRARDLLSGRDGALDPRTRRLALAALLAAAAFGVAVVSSTKLGVEALLALCFVPLAVLRLPIAICAWVVLLFFSRTSTFEAVPNKVLLFIGVCWIGLLLGRRTRFRGMLANNHAILMLVAGFVAWMLVSLAWAPDPGFASRPAKELLYASFGFLFVLGTTVDRRQVRWLLMAFVAGAAISVLWGAAKGGLSLSGGAASEVADTEGRFQGGAGDPNYLAAVLVPAIMLAGGLAIAAGARRRALLALATAIVAVGLAATQSRGGLLAGIACSIVALAIWRARRRTIVSLIVLAGTATMMFFLANPSALHRIEKSNQGSGRVDIWQVAWRVVHDHPFFGVGIAQFPQVSPHYVLNPGLLNYVNLIVEKHIVVHNLYLQLWAEDGIVGLLLFAAVVAASIAAGWRAAKSFDAQGDLEMSALARTVIIGLTGMLVASFFLSNLENGQLWILLALGPALAGIAARQPRGSPAP